MVASFAPVVDNRCRVLILGTMPGVQSLLRQEYYGHPQNNFWRIIYGLFGDLPDTDYERKKDYLVDHSIALWDVLQYCEREGSSDAAISSPVPNDIAGLLSEHPQIHSIFFNGAKAEELYKRWFKMSMGDERFTCRLPSTSPAHTMKLEEKLQQWQVVKARLENG